MKLQQSKDHLTINIILAYFQVLNDEDILQQSFQHKAVTDLEVIRLGILNRSGAFSLLQYYDLKG